MKIVCIGGSNVNGYPHKRSKCWVSLLRQKTGYEIINKGVDGNSTDEMLKRFEKDVIAHHPAIAILQAGLNDFMVQNRKPEEVLERIDKMIKLCQNSGIRPILLLPLQTETETASRMWFEDVDYEAVNQKVTTLSVLAADYGRKNGVQTIDLWSFYQAGFTDGIHMTEEGHRQTAALIETALQEW